MLILDEKNISNIKFKIKKPFIYGNNTIFELSCTNKFYLQSPSMLVPFSVNINDIKNTFTLTLCEYKSSIYTENINNIIKKIIENVTNKYQKLFENKIYIETLYIQPFNPIMFQFKNSKLDDIEIYNKFKEKISLLDILKDDMVTCIYHIKNIWINETHYGIKIELLQLRRDNNIQKGYFFIDSYNHNNNQNNNQNIELVNNKSNPPFVKSIPIKSIPIKAVLPTFNLKELLDKRNSIMGIT
jgi:hypothetical protein